MWCFLFQQFWRVGALACLLQQISHLSNSQEHFLWQSCALVMLFSPMVSSTSYHAADWVGRTHCWWSRTWWQRWLDIGHLRTWVAPIAMGTNALATLQQAAWFLLSCIELRELQGWEGPHTVPDGKSNISKEMARKEGLNLFPPCMISLRKCADIQFKWFSIWTKVLPDWLKNSDKEYKFRLKKFAFERNFAYVGVRGWWSLEIRKVIHISLSKYYWLEV